MAEEPQKPASPSGAWNKSSFQALLQGADAFVHCVELVTSRGLITERSGRRVLKVAHQLVEHPDIHALSITDNPGGNPMINADTMGTDLISRGQEVIIHLSCKDWNRNALQSNGWKLARASAFPLPTRILGAQVSPCRAGGMSTLKGESPRKWVPGYSHGGWDATIDGCAAQSCRSQRPGQSRPTPCLEQ